MKKDLDDSHFYISFVKESYSLYLFLFGVIVVGLLFIYGCIRATCLGFYSRNTEFVGHILALKTFSLVVYPSYAEYVNFCSGFMAVDLPWLNAMLPSSFANYYDWSPSGYLFYFRNMNFAAMHFFTVLIFLAMLIGGYFWLREPEKKKEKKNREN